MSMLHIILFSCKSCNKAKLINHFGQKIHYVSKAIFRSEKTIFASEKGTYLTSIFMKKCLAVFH